MRITLCVKRDLHGCIFLNQILPSLYGHEISVLLSDKHRPGENRIPELAEMAWLERTLPVETVFPMLDAEAHSKGDWRSFQGLAHFCGFSMSTVADRPALAEALDRLQPELIISARFSLIFTEVMIKATRYGIINIHPAALPQFAGLFGPMRTMAEGHDHFTCAVHLVDPGIDSGPLLYTADLPIRPGEALLHQIANIYPLAIPYLLDAIRQLSAGIPLTKTPQDRSTRRYRSFPDADEIAAFVAGGYRFYNAAAYEKLIKRFAPGWKLPQSPREAPPSTQQLPVAG